jgi:hypothetical protein
MPGLDLTHRRAFGAAGSPALTATLTQTEVLVRDFFQKLRTFLVFPLTKNRFLYQDFYEGVSK